MDLNLMDKEVLCALTTRQIQHYIFFNNSFIDTSGGNKLVSRILKDGIQFALSHIDTPLQPEEYDLSNNPDAPIPYFEDKNIKVQQILCSAGKALLILRTGALAQKIIRKVSRYYLDNAYSLNMIAAVVEKTNHMGNDVLRLYQKLDQVKATAHTLEPMGALPVTMREEKTGMPVITFDPERGDYISRASQLRRLESRRYGDATNLIEIPATRHRDKKEYWTVIHLDGNNFGITISSILQDTFRYEDGIRARRQINFHIESGYKRLVSRTMTDLENFYVANIGRAEDFPREFQLVHQGGDDLNYMGSVRLIFPFLKFFYKNLEGEFIWNTPQLKIPFYISAGLAFVTTDYDFHSAYQLAEECCKSAKTEAKKKHNLRNGLAGNWIDYQISDNPHAQRLSLLRDKAYTTNAGIHLGLRPYCLDKESDDSARSYRKLLQRVRNIRELPSVIRKANIMRQLYEMNKQEFSQWLRLQKERGVDFKARLGEPLYRDVDGTQYAFWFDAAELADFLPAELGD